MEYTFHVGDQEVYGIADLTKDQIEGLEVGGRIEIAYARSMPSVHRPSLLLAASTQDAPEPRRFPNPLLLAAFGLWVLIVFMCSWEHIYLFIRYFVRTGGLAWNQILKALHNAVFTMLSILLVFLVVGVLAAQASGVYADLWPWQAGAAVGIMVLLGLLLKWTPFQPSTRPPTGVYREPRKIPFELE